MFGGGIVIRKNSCFLVIGVVIAILGLFTALPAGTYVCGDANADGAVDISDAVHLVAHIFSGGSAPQPLLAGDANHDGAVDISDVVYLIAYIFSGGAQPPCSPRLTTAAVSAVSQTTAQCGGTVTSDGGTAITARGVCWSTNLTPTVADNKSTDGAGMGSFTSSITGLTASTPYYVCAYATNSVGTGYGDIRSFTTAASIGTVTDIDGNVYQTVTIGTQVWMAENLKVTHYRDGDAIPNVIDGATWTGLTTGAFCSYNNDVNNDATYGKLYNWYALSDSRNIAPVGWHVATDVEWKQLEMYLGMSQTEADQTGWRGTDEGGKMKEVGTTHWLSPNIGATNESGFSGLPGGYRYLGGQYYDVGSHGVFWSSTQASSGFAWCRNLGSAFSGVHRYDGGKADGFSVRCVKDPTVTDIDGNVYQTVTIGTQVWMAKNLKVTRYRNGDAIPNVTSGATWAGLSTGAYCNFNNDVNNVATYGRLYNWFAASDSRNIAPTGWHVPTDAEWKQLEAYLGISQAELDLTGYRGTSEGGKLKETGTTHWLSPNTGATNESGFTALPGALRDHYGTYYDLRFYSTFYTCSPSIDFSAWSRHLNAEHAEVYRYNYDRRLGFSIRCVRD